MITELLFNVSYWQSMSREYGTNKKGSINNKYFNDVLDNNGGDYKIMDVWLHE